MKSSLRLRVALLIVALNVTVGVVALLFALRQAGRDREATARAFEQVAFSLAGNLVDTVARQVDPDAGLNVARLLAWESWPAFADALVCDHRLTRADGRVLLGGIAVNPLGRKVRDPGADEQVIFNGLRRALDEQRSVDAVEGGRAMPIFVRGRLWGACWFRLKPPPLSTDLITAYFVPAFLGSTLLISLATFFALRRFVLDPVSQLAQAANRVAAGDYSVRLSESPSQDELSLLVRRFNAMTDQVELLNTRLEQEVRRQTEQTRRAEAAAMTQRRLAAMGELAAGIAHEINNPLGGLQNAVERLERGDLEPEKRARYLELLSSGLERIRRTVGQLLRFTPRRASPEPLSLLAPVEDALALVRHRAQRQNVSMNLSDGRGGDPAELRARLEALPPVEGEQHELGQAVLNLLVNALDALEEAPPAGGGRIDVRLSQEGRELVVEVRDDGPGVPEESLPRLADLFYTTKPPGKGTGLGLGIVHQVAARHGGRLELRSKPGRGFSASLYLPVLQASAGGRPEGGVKGRERP
ncbi:MAG: HAMP domain-containing protein [Planctomycetes bacterium]|nr:HAMP domain-containing protein [Planctomycetota bacterium]